MKEARQERAWIHVLEQAVVEVSSEDELFPITAALGHALTNGWRAATTGPQVVRLIFSKPRQVERLLLHVIDRVSERTQEVVVRAGESVEALGEVARWNFTFSPRGSTEELEESAVAIEGVSVVELRIDPDVRRSAESDQAYATIKSFWLA